MKNLKKELLQTIKDYTFFEFIHKIYYRDRKREELLTALRDAHNDKEIDLIAAFGNLSNSPEHHDFFALRRIFEKVLADLDAPVLETAQCVKHLTKEAGNDMAAGILVPHFIEFCTKEPSRPDELLDHAQKEFQNEFDHLSIAIIAGTKIDRERYTKQAIELLKSEHVEIKQRAIYALGRIDYDGEELLKNAALAIVESASSSQDFILATSIRALFSITTQSDELDELYIEFLDSHSMPYGEQYVHSASEILFHESEKTSTSIEKKLLDICCYTPAENTGTINNIDYVLEAILKRGDFDLCVTFLEKFFELSRYKVSVKSFDSFVRELHNHRDSFLSTLITRWLLAQKLYLCKFSYDLLETFDEGIPLTFDLSCIPTDQENVHLYLARKACGWFFAQPKTAISLIASLVPQATEDELDDIEQIIFNPLLVSYPKSITEMMESSKGATNTKLANLATNILARNRNYKDGIEAAHEINELRPTESERHTYWRHHSKLMDESMKKARSESVLLSLFAGNESVLLYGNKSIHYVQNDDKKTRQEIPLQQLSHSIEVASLLNLDPHGLERIIWRLKSEGCES